MPEREFFSCGVFEKNSLHSEFGHFWTFFFSHPCFVLIGPIIMLERAERLPSSNFSSFFLYLSTKSPSRVTDQKYTKPKRLMARDFGSPQFASKIHSQSVSGSPQFASKTFNGTRAFLCILCFAIFLYVFAYFCVNNGASTALATD